jgi:hypothetical protein
MCKVVIPAFIVSTTQFIVSTTQLARGPNWGKAGTRPELEERKIGMDTLIYGYDARF